MGKAMGTSMNPPSDPIVGIDLGTTNSLVAYADPARGLSPAVLKDEAGRSLLPSVVRYDGRGVPEAVGFEAKEHAAESPHRTIASVKRLMGRSARDSAADLPYLGYEVVEGANQTARIRLPIDAAHGGGEKIVSPPEVSAVILRRLKQQATRALGVEVRRAVVTVPAYFDDAQRQATRDAGRLAGLEIVRIVNEPTAAALAYGIGLTTKQHETIAVFDLGGGTFDVSILSVIPAEEGATKAAPDARFGADFFQVLSTAGDTHLGGDDVDQMITRALLDEAARAGVAGAPSPSEVQGLRLAAEQLKIRLSDAPRAEIESLVAGRMVRLSLSRSELESMATPWIERALESCARALRDARVTTAEISKVVMVGGSTRMPLVNRRVAEFFGREPYTALSPDMVVAIGAAVQASIMAGLRADALLLDVIPLSLGIETVGGAAAKLIVRNSTVPARASEMFSTSVDGQTSIKLTVLQGEREMAADCRSLGTFHLRGIPPMPAGIPQVQVDFLVDASGVLNVSAIERRSGTRASIQIVPNHGLTRDEVERMEAESLVHAREDMTRHRVVDLIANSKLDLKWIGERLKKMSMMLDPAYQSAIREKSAALEAMVHSAEADWRSVDADAFHRAKETLDQLSVKLHEKSIAMTLMADPPKETGKRPRDS